ncbi:MAG: DNA-directed RNA polymerase subunit alpha C-terminal domain-containing protein [Phycisphaerae bacterium]
MPLRFPAARGGAVVYNCGYVEQRTMTTTLETIAEEIRAGHYEEAHEALDGAQETDETHSELMFLRGYLQEMSYDREAALASYQAVMEQDPDHAEATFRAALLCDQGGDDETAIELYERCTATAPAHVNALINLAVLYEESGKLLKAETCLVDVLEEHPNHWRARHFLESVESSYTMVYDEQTQRERERHNAVLDVPISDFELSVRSRNCLRQMNIRTLGDLLRIGEAELLSYKNFGETSLNEIKAMLTQKGLKLGQGLQPPEQTCLPAPTPVSNDDTARLDTSVSELELSVRSRKALQRLGVSTLNELAQRTESELVAIKNFGQTSLYEIRRQLAIHGLSLRQTGG